MVVIVKPGDPEKIKLINYKLSFKCEYCDCEFKVNKNDTRWSLVGDYVIYNYKCPDCGSKVKHEEFIGE